MKYYIFLIATFFCAQASSAQNFEEISKTSLSGDELRGKLVDLNNNSSIDYIYLQESDTEINANILRDINGLPIPLELEGINNMEFSLGDLDNNNRLDVVTSLIIDRQNVVAVFYQLDNLTFSEPQIVDTLDFKSVTIYDVNRDGQNELLIVMEDALTVYEKKDSNNWEHFNSLELNGIDDLKLFDYDNRDLNELLVSYSLNDELVTELFQLEEDEWESDSTFAILRGISLTSYADHNLDGQYDLYTLTRQQSGSSISIIVNDDFVEVISTNDHLEYWFTADFNSDGMVDILTTGKSNTDDHFIRLYTNSGDDSFTPEDIGVVGEIESLHVFDQDYDGDLDVVLRTQINGIQELTTYDNITSSVNDAPTIVPEHFSFTKLDGVVIIWENAEDDFTLAQSINYDIFIGRTSLDSDIESPHFDLSNLRRLKAIKGNAGLRGEYNLHKPLESGIYSYGIQSIDNALHYLIGSDGVGDGDGSPLLALGEFIVCDELDIEEIYLCEGETFNYQFDGPTYVYSSNDGYLGALEELLLGNHQTDTLYITVPNSLSCDDNRSIIVQTVLMDELLEESAVTVCFDSTVELELSMPADNVSWISSSGLSSDSLVFSYVPTINDSVFVEVMSNGCKFRDSIAVNIQPAINLDRIEYTINLGESVRIETGLIDVSNIDWSPVNGLSDISISPMASPDETTLYLMQANDSVGCNLELEVLVNVVSLGFIPNLFTPNDDRENDRLVVYGLGSTENFNFSIYNRFGSLVFETTDTNSLISTGWDGTWQGKDQPNGAYYWKVSGTFSSGQPASLNGKKEGVVHLMR